MNKAYKAILGALLLAAVLAAQDRKPKTTLFVATYGHGPKWVPGKGAGAQPGIRRHADYMIALHRAGQLEHGGPFLDGRGGMSVLRVRDATEAKALVARDPAIVSGVMKLASLRPWLSIDWARFAREVAANDPKRSVARVKCKEYYDAARFWRVIKKSYPRTLAEMEAPIRDGDDEKYVEIEKDPWGHAYTIEFEDGKPRIRSPGPDGKPRTPDDIKYPE